MVRREPHKPDWDNPPYLRDRCKEFLAGQDWLCGYDGPDDDDVDRLVKFVVEELYRAGAIY